MNLEQPSTPTPLDLHVTASSSVAEQLEHKQQHHHQRPPIEYLSFQGMRRSSAGQEQKGHQPQHQDHKSNPLRHSTGTMMTVMDASSNTSYNNPSMEISISDLKNHNRRRHHHLEDSSSKTATTVNSSYHNNTSHGNQSALFGNSFIRASNSTLDTSDCSALAATQPRRGGSLNDLDDSSGLSISSSGRRRELRNLKGIRRRRSDPVTRRWREQCSKLYKEHVLLDSCPEQQQQNQPPPLTATPQVLAATKLQAWVRAALRQRKGCRRQQTTSS